MAGTGRPGPECAVKRALDRMDERNREIAEIVLGDRESYTNPFVRDAINELMRQDDPGYSIHVQTVKFHRAGDCRCAIDEVQEEVEAA